MPEGNQSSPMPYLTAGAQAAGNIGGQIIANIGNKKAQKRAYEYNLDMWNRMNAYNHPKQQMSRYKEAGLNPNLMYGQGSPGNAQQMAKYQAPEYSFSMPDALGMLGQYQQMQLQRAQTQNVTADTAISHIDKALKDLEKEYKQMEIDFEKSDSTAQSSGHWNHYWKVKKQAQILNQQKIELLTESIKQAKTFNQYMDYSQMSKILRDVMPIVHLLFGR